ncbi:MAG: hypothetical protein JSS29_11960 [Proteobacteria bacterium]|nr:hypothetical protein [Pseudomonadota bacterium]
MLKFSGIALGLVVVVLALWSWVSLSWVYSDGERAGYVQKFSRRGYVCKTWEGQMAMVTMPGTLAEKFDFTVREPDVAKAINENIGSRLVLHYEQHKWIPNSCFGETEYFVTKVTVAESPQPLPAAPQPGVPASPAPAPAAVPQPVPAH